MKRGKTAEARDRYIEAFITEPYNKFTVAGLVQWAQATQTSLAHPTIDIPTGVTFDVKVTQKSIWMRARCWVAMMDRSPGFPTVQLVLNGTRKPSRKNIPVEKYRHSLAEEVEALRSVITLATSDKKQRP